MVPHYPSFSWGPPWTIFSSLMHGLNVKIKVGPLYSTLQVTFSFLSSGWTIKWSWVDSAVPAELVSDGHCSHLWPPVHSCPLQKNRVENSQTDPKTPLGRLKQINICLKSSVIRSFRLGFTHNCQCQNLIMFFAKSGPYKFKGISCLLFNTILHFEIACHQCHGYLIRTV